MAEQLKIFHADDDPTFRFTVRSVLGLLQSDVVEAGTKGDALSIVPQLEKLGVSIAFVDGNLDDPNDFSGNDGREIAKAIKKLTPSIVVIGLSGTGLVEGADVSLEKTQKVLLSLPETIRPYLQRGNKADSHH